MLLVKSQHHHKMQHVSETKFNASMPQTHQAADQSQQGSIKMTLENADLWKSFHSFGTEMIIAKHGRRMFPHCNISLSGLQPYTNYIIMVDMVPVDNFKYKWNKEQWEVAGKGEPQPPCRTYLHPDSPATGSHWMKRSLSFLKMKLTNNTLDQHGHIILHSMHRYYPRFHVIQADSPYTMHWGPYQTFSFPETSFTAVTAYQNIKITKLKIDHNPFAKGFREGGTHFHGKRCRSSKSPNKSVKKAKLHGEDPCKSPPDQQRAHSACPSAKQGKSLCTESLKEGRNVSPWAVEQHTPDRLHAPELHRHDYSEEQMVPTSTSYQPHRFADYGRQPSPSPVLDDCDVYRGYGSSLPDVATVPVHHQAAGDVGPQHRPPQSQEPRYANAAAPSSTGMLGYPMYPLEQGGCQWGEVHSLVHPSPHVLASADRAAYHHHGNAAEWSQYPLFSYSCW